MLYLVIWSRLSGSMYFHEYWKYFLAVYEDGIKKGARLITKPFHFQITSLLFLTVAAEYINGRKISSESKLSTISIMLPSQISVLLMISSAGTSKTWSCLTSEEMVHDPKRFQVKWKTNKKCQTNNNNKYKQKSHNKTKPPPPSPLLSPPNNEIAV